MAASCRALEGVAKLCQRKLYSWLSSRCGLPVCIVGTILVFVSVLQFGEVLLEWSKDKYEYQFSIYADNIAGKSYERYLCPELPIDIVYTWVNGSDPELLEALRELKRQSATSNHTENSTETAASISQGTHNLSLSLSCPFSHCVPFHTLLLDARTLPLLPLSSLPSLSPLLANASAVHMVNSPAAHLSPVHAVQLPSEEHVTRVLREDITDNSGQKIQATRGFLTNDSSVVGAVRMENFAIVVCEGITSANSTAKLRKWMTVHFHDNLTAVEVKGEGLGVVEFRSGVLARILHSLGQRQRVFSGQPLHLLPAYLIWTPFSPPSQSDGANGTAAVGRGSDGISASRFEDNEEMRYSLRSVVAHAPWVRHIFIVTNGQIPSWLNLDNPRITLVTHEDIFPNRSHLPTFSSPAIETHLHRIPGLSKRFIYLNDDVMFGAPIWPEDFFTPQIGQKVYLSWPVPYCAEGCPPNWITDHYCDQACNNSMCDWDGGDCAGATRYGWRGGGGGGGGGGGAFGTHNSWNRENCNAGCLNNWLGDRYCDQACRVPACGYDAGDCGTELWETLYSVVPRPNHTHIAPLDTTAMFFNLTSHFRNGTISSAEHSPCPVIRTAVLAQTFKTIGLTFARNCSLCTSNFTVNGTSGTGAVVTLTFGLSADTVSQNESLTHHSHADSLWNFPEFNTTHSNKFLEAVVEKIQIASVNYWTTQHSQTHFTAAPVTEYTRYMVGNTSLLPVGVANELAQLEAEWKGGDITSRGYLKRRGQILEEYPHLRQANGSVTFGAGGREGVGLVGGATRRLLSLPPDEERQREEPVKSLRGDIVRAVTSWEHRHGPWDPNYKGWERRRLPWERLRIFPEEGVQGGEEGVQGGEEGEGDPYTTAPHRGRHLMDVYGDSLRFVNKLLTRAYGHDSRKVPAHMPHMINREVMDELQSRYPVEFDETSSHKLRSSDDMQFSFSYFYYLMSEKRSMDITDAFAELDSDQSGILSVRELRTMLAMISELPLHLEIVHNFEALLRECDSHYNGTRPTVDPVQYETHYDPNLPLVTLDFVRQCQPLLEKLNSTVHSQLKYKFEVVGEEQIAFKMINENATKVMEMLDEIRKEKKKFICLNDNIDHLKEGAHLAKLILLDFYESMFPYTSPFELPPQYRNRFLHVSELNEWVQFRGRVQLALHVTCGVLLTLTVISLFYGKIIQWKRRIVRHFVSLVSRDRTRPPSV